MRIKYGRMRVPVTIKKFLYGRYHVVGGFGFIGLIKMDGVSGSGCSFFFFSFFLIYLGRVCFTESCGCIPTNPI